MTKPTIAELEAILNAPDSKVEIGNDGTVRARGYLGGDIAGGAAMTEAARLKAKEAIRRLRELFADVEKAWGDACADTLGDGMEKEKAAHAIIAELCSAIETCHLHQTNEYVENALKRARDFLEANK